MQYKGKSVASQRAGLGGYMRASPLAHSSAAHDSHDVTRSTSSLPLRSAGAGSAAERAGERGLGSAPGSSLRSTLHTDTLRAAERPRAMVERNLQSADVSSRGGWRGVGSSASASRSAGGASAGGYGATHRTGVARTLAPNGQPRKVPVAMLPQYHAGLSGGSLAGRASAPNLHAMAAAEAAGIKAGVQLRYGMSPK